MSRLLSSVASFMKDIILGWMGQMIPTPQFSEEVGYVRNLKRNVDDLMEEGQKLKDQCDDMESEGREAPRKRMRLTNQAQTWLGHARANLTEIENIKSVFNETQTNNGFFSDLPSTYTLGKRTVEKLECVRQHLNKRRRIKLLAMSSPPRVMVMDVPTVGQGSAQRTMEKIWNLLHDEHTSVICVYGMGGIGKTTLMKAINNKLQATREFDCVIWVTVPNDLNLKIIQKDIMGRLEFVLNESHSFRNRSAQLYRYLTSKRYLLILDDLWDSFNLSEVGIPTNQNGSKIAITTRLHQVCTDMKAEEVRVETLSKEEAWDLFAANSGEVVHRPHIKVIANDVAMECGGLPLAIMVVAKAMHGRNKVQVWKDALRALRAPTPLDIHGMECKVFRPLKKSYDDLRDEKVKMCFLYCSLFPKDYEISVNGLVQLWMEEGFIDIVDDLVDASNKGHGIVEMLKSKCLLEEGIQSDSEGVKMHGIIRDLALYIASSSCSEGPKFLVKAGLGLKKPPREETWREFERISLMMNEITELPIKPECPNLISLFLTKNPITALHDSFFELMPALQVLDLSHTSITSMSVSSSSLSSLRSLNLRGCKTLIEVPFLGQLKELQFLDIKSSDIRSLPKEMQTLVKLKKLNMSNLYSFRTIPSNVMSGLSSLEDLRMHWTNVNWVKGSELAVENDVALGEVGILKRLTTLKITIRDSDCVEDDLFLQQLSKLKKFKVLIGRRQLTPRRMDCMKQVHINGGNNYPRGVQVMVTHAEGLGLHRVDVKDVSQLVGAANGLKMLNINWAKTMEYILDWSDVGENALQSIEKLDLMVLPKLQKLFEGEVPQQCLRNLREIHLCGCEQLKSLFSSEMVKNLLQLQTLDVSYCEGLEEIIEGDTAPPEYPFPQLCYLKLLQLHNLKSITRGDTLVLPSLIKLEIQDCPDLWLPERPNTTDWPSNTSGNATWQANPQHMHGEHLDATASEIHEEEESPIT